jgi:hypothetical protein
MYQIIITKNKKKLRILKKYTFKNKAVRFFSKYIDRNSTVKIDVIDNNYLYHLVLYDKTSKTIIKSVIIDLELKFGKNTFTDIVKMYLKSTAINTVSKIGKKIILFDFEDYNIIKTRDVKECDFLYSKLKSYSFNKKKYNYIFNGNISGKKASEITGMSISWLYRKK